MKRTNLQKMTVPQLVEQFVQIAIEQDEALLDDETARYNRLYGEMEEVKEELKSRDNDQRRALLPSLNHANAQVRLKAAMTTLALAPVTARHALQAMVDQNEYPQAADARGILRALDQGTNGPR